MWINFCALEMMERPYYMDYSSLRLFIHKTVTSKASTIFKEPSTHRILTTKTLFQKNFNSYGKYVLYSISQPKYRHNQVGGAFSHQGNSFLMPQLC